MKKTQFWYFSQFDWRQKMTINSHHLYYYCNIDFKKIGWIVSLKLILKTAANYWAKDLICFAWSEKTNQAFNKILYWSRVVVFDEIKNTLMWVMPLLPLTTFSAFKPRVFLPLCLSSSLYSREIEFCPKSKKVISFNR